MDAWRGRLLDCVHFYHLHLRHHTSHSLPSFLPTPPLPPPPPPPPLLLLLTTFLQHFSRHFFTFFFVSFPAMMIVFRLSTHTNRLSSSLSYSLPKDPYFIFTIPPQPHPSLSSASFVSPAASTPHSPCSIFLPLATRLMTVRRVRTDGAGGEESYVRPS